MKKERTYCNRNRWKNDRMINTGKNEGMLAINGAKRKSKTIAITNRATKIASYTYSTYYTIYVFIVFTVSIWILKSEILFSIFPNSNIKIQILCILYSNNEISFYIFPFPSPCLLKCQKRFYTRGTLRCIRFSRFAKIPTIYRDWLNFNYEKG